jgi:methylase of polypeptide subunit release factors
MMRSVASMNELPPRPTSLAQQLLAGCVEKGDRVIDATAGNGHDTLFLAELVGESGRVLAFDIQEEAIVSARERIQAAGFSDRVTFHQASHASMADHGSEGSFAAVMFNLGYLPGADHEVATGSDTLIALEAATSLLGKGGALSVVCYPGHEGGDAEAAEVERWMAGLPANGWRVAKYGAIGTRRPAPFLLFGVKG